MPLDIKLSMRIQPFNVSNFNPWQRRPNLLSRLRMPRLPPFHTATIDAGANALRNTSTSILVQLKRLQPQLGIPSTPLGQLGHMKDDAVLCEIGAVWSIHQAVSPVELS